MTTLYLSQLHPAFIWENVVPVRPARESKLACMAVYNSYLNTQMRNYASMFEFPSVAFSNSFAEFIPTL